jgi:RNA polymerase sigma factor for flagellar operon FliA
MANPSDTLVEQLPLIEQIIRAVCRGRRMNAAQIEDFAGFVKLRLIENDYAIIRKFKGRSSFGTFVTTVISRLLNDYTDRERGGRWRHSAEAKRMGPLAEELELLLVRDKRTFDEAFGELSAKHPGITRPELEAIAERFPVRHRATMSSLEDCEVPIAGAHALDAGKAEMLKILSMVISKFIAGLPKEDQLIVQLRFEDDMPVPRIASALHLDMQSVYRRLRRHYRDLRRMVEKAGISKEDVDGLTGQDGALLDFHLKTDDEHPSNDEDPDGAPEESAE